MSVKVRTLFSTCGVNAASDVRESTFIFHSFFFSKTKDFATRMCFSPFLNWFGGKFIWAFVCLKHDGFVTYDVLG